MLTVGDLVSPDYKSSKKYRNKSIWDAVGIVEKVNDYNPDKISYGIRFNNVTNGNSQYGLFWFNENQLILQEEKREMDTIYAREAFKIMIDAWCISNKYKLEYANRPHDNVDKVYRFKVYGPGCMKTYFVDFDQMDNIYECMNSIVTDFSKFSCRGKLETSTTYGVTTPSIRNVYFNYPYVIVMWSDKTKTMVKCSEDDFYDPEKGLALAISKKFLGTNKNKSNYYEVFKQFLPEERPLPTVDSAFRTLSEKLRKCSTISFIQAKEAFSTFAETIDFSNDSEENSNE